MPVTQPRPRGTALQEGDQVIERAITGHVKWYDDKKGIGYLTADDGREIYVHHSGLATRGYKELQKGEFVTFDIADGKRGLKCINVVNG